MIAFRAFGLAGVLVLSAGCGYVGDPQPPALNIPEPVKDLQAMEYGSNLLVRFSMPTLTTEGLPLKRPREIQIYTGAASDPFDVNAWGASAKKLILTPTDAESYQQEIPVGDLAGKDIVIAVKVTGPKGRVSGWSNLQRFTAVAPMEQPRQVKAETVEHGVMLSGQGSGAKFRIFRAEGDGKLERFAESDKPEYLDETAEYAKRYQYVVQAVLDERRQSVASDAVVITPVDKFPPAVPGALTALAGVSSVELAWTRNAEPDFKGYNVYRAEGDGDFQKIATLVEAPAYSDSTAQKGKRYRYAVTAVDTSGNESARSNPQEAVIP